MAASSSPSFDDYAFGRGATSAEKALAYVAGMLLALYVIWLYAGLQPRWALWKLILALPIALDLGAGAIANSLESCRRFYHAPPEPGEGALARRLKNPLFFAALHIYPIIVGLVYGPWNWRYALGGYALLLVACLMVLRAPFRLRRPFAYFTLLLAVISPLFLPTPAGFAWLMPVLFLKIVLGHMSDRGSPNHE